MKKILGKKKKDEENITAYYAAQNGLLDMLKNLITADESAVGFKDEATGQTPLHVAAGFGHLPCVIYLLGWGANPNAEDKKLRTPLIEAVQNGQHKVRSVLI